jgi:methionyl-tRNA formyltransferase
MIWQVLEGKNEIVVTLLQAEDKVDSGRIWCQKKLYFEGHELAEEMNEALFDTEIDLMNFAVENESTVKPFSQSNERATFYRKRTPNDSKIDPQKSISSQFDLLRVSDPERYPAFFEHRGHRYKISISKMDVKRNE